MTLELPKDLQTQAEWWCAVNGYAPIPGHDHPLPEADNQALFDTLTAMPGVLEHGLALWKQRLDAGLYPQSGLPRPPQRPL